MMAVVTVWEVLLICASFAGCVASAVWGWWTYREAVFGRKDDHA